MISKNFCLGFLVFIEFKLTIADFYNKRSEITPPSTGKSVKQLVSQLTTHENKNNELNYIQSSSTSLMIITSRMSTTYNDGA